MSAAASLRISAAAAASTILSFPLVAGRGGFDQLDSNQDVHGYVLRGFKLLYQIAAPGLKPVRPGLQSIKMTALSRRH